MTVSTNVRRDDQARQSQDRHSGSKAAEAPMPPLPARHELHAYATPPEHHTSTRTGMPRFVRS
ncbi:MAG: hypothetical protein NTV35_09180, partial [Chloroflexi bacterium]|nr:hypothetical protein [Chloroflexota bacterium]